MIEQKDGNDWLPLGFFSKKKLSGAQIRYSTYDRELLAPYLSTRHHFINSIEGRSTALLTDHKPLLYIMFRSEKYVDRQGRHIAFLSKFITAVEHVQGTDNVVPDALSRRATKRCT